MYPLFADEWARVGIHDGQLTDRADGVPVRVEPVGHCRTSESERWCSLMNIFSTRTQGPLRLKRQKEREERLQGSANTALQNVRRLIGAAEGGRIAHDFRCTAVRNLERQGVSRSVAMKIPGTGRRGSIAATPS